MLIMVFFLKKIMSDIKKNLHLQNYLIKYLFLLRILLTYGFYEDRQKHKTKIFVAVFAAIFLALSRLGIKGEKEEKTDNH